MASTLPNTLNVARFFNRKDFSNTVEIIVNETKFMCSGAVIAQQSPVFEQLFTGGASFVLLDEFFFPGSEIVIEECLMLLYGGKVMFTMNNIKTLTRFSLIYDVKFMYDMCFQWLNENVSPQNIAALFDIGNLPEVKSRKVDFINFCKDFMKSKETDVSQEMTLRLKNGSPVVHDFIRTMVELTNCPALVEFLVEFCKLSEQNTLFILELSDFINFDNLFVEYKELFNGLMLSMKSNMESTSGLKHLLDIQMSALRI